jgi:hypothetical protein
MFRENCGVVRQWFPKSEMLVVQNATRWLQLTNTTGLAEGFLENTAFKTFEQLLIPKIIFQLILEDKRPL